MPEPIKPELTPTPTPIPTPKPDPPKPDPPKVEAKPSLPDLAEKTTKVSYANHIEIDLGKEIKTLEEIAKRAQKASVTFAEAKIKYFSDLAENTQVSDLKKRKTDGDYYARRRVYGSS